MLAVDVRDDKGSFVSCVEDGLLVRVGTWRSAVFGLGKIYSTCTRSDGHTFDTAYGLEHGNDIPGRAWINMSPLLIYLCLKLPSSGL